MRGYDSIFEQRYSRDTSSSREGRFLLAMPIPSPNPFAPVRQFLKALLHVVRRPANMGTGVRW